MYGYLLYTRVDPEFYLFSAGDACVYPKQYANPSPSPAACPTA
jgi:hypothetical protein